MRQVRTMTPSCQSGSLKTVQWTCPHLFNVSQTLQLRASCALFPPRSDHTSSSPAEQLLAPGVCEVPRLVDHVVRGCALMVLFVLQSCSCALRGRFDSLTLTQIAPQHCEKKWSARSAKIKGQCSIKTIRQGNYDSFLMWLCINITINLYRT